MEREEIAAEVEALLQPITAHLGLETVDVQVQGDGERTVLRVLLDRPEGGITVEECARASEQLSRQLDLYDLFPHAYTLEVSSPGLDRPLRRDAEFRRFAGRRAEIQTHAAINGQRRFRGILLGVMGDAVVLELAGRRQVQIPKAAIQRAQLIVEPEDLRADLHRSRGGEVDR
ncbi:MAG TPA: ribosome maturation factor RimP [bacterium]|nr:ribosome maturation factor RimP [bacterium]